MIATMMTMKKEALTVIEDKSFSLMRFNIWITLPKCIQSLLLNLLDLQEGQLLYLLQG